MENSLLIGLSRQIALQRELEVVANNVANLNTTGYKADGNIFAEFLMPTARAGQFQPGDQKLSYVQDTATWHDLSAGAVQQTGNPLDVAIDGDAYFAIQTPRGERYTRNGAFQVNAQGQLVTSAGDVVQGDGGPIQIQPTDRNIVISETGTITVREGSNANTSSTRGKLRLVGFVQPQRLQKEGSSLFSAPANLPAQPAPRTARVLQGAIEQSNVRGVVEMARMIEVTRNYSQIAGLLQQGQDLRTTAIDRLAEVPA
jgi:flagellar basal-body rod protein FlgF